MDERLLQPWAQSLYLHGMRCLWRSTTCRAGCSGSTRAQHCPAPGSFLQLLQAGLLTANHLSPVFAAVGTTQQVFLAGSRSGNGSPSTNPSTRGLHSAPAGTKSHKAGFRTCVSNLSKLFWAWDGVQLCPELPSASFHKWS